MGFHRIYQYSWYFKTDLLWTIAHHYKLFKIWVVNQIQYLKHRINWQTCLLPSPLFEHSFLTNHNEYISNFTGWTHNWHGSRSQKVSVELHFGCDKKWPISNSHIPFNGRMWSSMHTISNYGRTIFNESKKLEFLTTLRQYEIE